MLAASFLGVRAGACFERACAHMGSSGSNRSFSSLDSYLAMTDRVCNQGCRVAMSPAT